jgi:putative intracellular protease/amidase
VDQSRSTPSNAYGLEQPTLADARNAVYRVFPGAQGDDRWPALLATAGLAGNETDLEAVQRLVRAMTASRQAVIALCARSLNVRVAAYRHLSATHELVSGAHQ